MQRAVSSNPSYSSTITNIPVVQHPQTSTAPRPKPQCLKCLELVDTVESVAQFPEASDGILCRKCAEAEKAAWNAEMLKQIPFGPWAQGWKGKLARWLLRLKEDADKRIAEQRSG